jgi:hypothetical protein
MTKSNYVEQFFATDFTPYQHLANDIVDSDTLIDNQVPLVKIPVADTTLITRLHEFCLANQEQFKVPELVDGYNHFWYQYLHTKGWKQFIVRHNRPSSLVTFDKSTTLNEHHTQSDDVNQIASGLIDQLFGSFGLTVRHARLNSLEPDGYFAPHVDVYQKDPGLCYVWMPLHDAVPHLKIFPFGLVNSEFGNMYLLNYSKYTHSVWNQKKQTRFVLGAVFDIDQVPPEFIQLFREQKKSYRQLF